MKFLFDVFMAICVTLTSVIISIIGLVVWPFRAIYQKLWFGHVVFTFMAFLSLVVSLWTEDVPRYWAIAFKRKRK